MSENTDSSNLDQDKSPSASTSDLPDSTVSNGLENKGIEPVKSNKRKSSRDSDSSTNMTNKDIPVTPSQRARMRSRSKSSNSEDLKSEKPTNVPETETTAAPTLENEAVTEDKPVEEQGSAEIPSSSNETLNIESAANNSVEKEESVKNEISPVRISNRIKRKKSESIESKSPTKEPSSPVKTNEESSEVIKDSIKPESSTPMDVDDENSSDFLGFEAKSNYDKYSKFSLALRPYEEPSEVSSKKGSSNGVLEPIVKMTRISYKSSPSNRVDINDPVYKKPFEFGWKRELVFRSTSDNSLTRSADVYYYTPANKKVRSMREVLDHLPANCGLTAENFTFSKGVIGIDDPEKEIVREANYKGSRSSDQDGFYMLPLKKTPKVKAATVKPKEKKEFIRDDVIELSPSSSPSTSRGSPFTPKIAMKTTSKTATKKLVVKVDKKRRTGAADDSSADIEDWCPEPKAQVREVCSIDCRLAMGLIPTLQCIKCLCLYHPECVNLPEAKDRQIHSYVCKYCQSTPKTTIRPPPPPLTPIVAPQPQKKEIMKVLTPVIAPMIAPIVVTTANTTTPRSQTIVGAVTTWLPPASSIQVNTKVPQPIAPRPEIESSPQSLISVQGKKYVVIPKLNRVKLDGRGEGGEEAVPAVNTPTPNPPGVYLVPYNLPSASGTYVVQAPNTTAPTYIVASTSASAPINSVTNGLKRSASDTSGSDGSPPAKMSAVSPKSAPTVKSVGVPKQAPKVSPAPKQSGAKSPKAPSSSTAVAQPPRDFMNMFNAGYTGLVNAFQYLKVHELLRAACVCKMWRHLASHRSLWETVKMKNSRVRNWDGFAKSLRNNFTKCLDLKKMLLPDGSEAVSEMWKNMATALKTVPTLTKIDLGRCTPENLEIIAKSCPQLESIVALSIRGQNLDLSMFKGDKLVELKLKSVGGMEVTHFSALKKLTKLKHLSLTSVKNLSGLENCLPISLESLELGECCIINEAFASETLPKMKNLKRLRLEKGQGSSSFLISAISGLEKLSQLELINFDIKPGFDKALAKCVHVKTLLIIPTYVTQSATTNHVVIGGVSKLSSTLEYFIWGLTLELLRVTDLFIDQVEGQKQKAQAKKGTGDSIPILKPLTEEAAEPSKEGQTTSQVDILALPKLQKVLSTLLPTTKVKILKVPFSATWRQTVE